MLNFISPAPISKSIQTNISTNVHTYIHKYIHSYIQTYQNTKQECNTKQSIRFFPNLFFPCFMFLPHRCTQTQVVKGKVHQVDHHYPQPLHPPTSTPDLIHKLHKQGPDMHCVTTRARHRTTMDEKV